ncbi:hypothetical protein GRJ2_002466500 [Grus japonensis]|uniref:Uncharacterized protein n=1 Tax=Grus japonensis TaxID=30415 RepID=A0ABC9XRG5_GRUJA
MPRYGDSRYGHHRHRHRWYGHCWYGHSRYGHHQHRHRRYGHHQHRHSRYGHSRCDEQDAGEPPLPQVGRGPTKLLPRIWASGAVGTAQPPLLLPRSTEDNEKSSEALVANVSS